jgi:hypothetical protein
MSIACKHPIAHLRDTAVSACAVCRVTSNFVAAVVDQYRSLTGEHIVRMALRAEQATLPRTLPVLFFTRMGH